MRLVCRLEEIEDGELTVDLVLTQARKKGCRVRGGTQPPAVHAYIVKGKQRGRG